MQTVHVRVNDAATGRPTPVRVRFTGPDGTYYAPFGRLADFATGWNEDVGGNLLYGDKKYAYIDGTCEIRLPPGQIHVEVWKGFEYFPLYQELTLKQGQLALRFTIQRQFDLRRSGWYSGDSQAHFLTPHAALLEAAAEDLAVVNLLARDWTIITQQGGNGGPRTHPAIPNILAFSGQHPALESPGHLVVVNTLNSHPTLGSLALLNCHRAVYPLSFGYAGAPDDWTLADWCDQCHRKGGLVVWAEAPGAPSSQDYFDREPLADLVLGKVDALEVGGTAFPGWPSFAPWYQLLNSGLHVPLIGASGKSSNLVPLGYVRTYAGLGEGEEFSCRTWVEAVRAGRSFVTNGPLLSLTANGQRPGAALDLPAATPIRVEAEAHSLRPFGSLELVANGAVVATAPAVGAGSDAVIEMDLTLPDGGWLAARCHGPERLPSQVRGHCGYAHTSPVTVRVGGRPPKTDPTAVAGLLAHLEKMQAWAEREARCDERQRQRLVAIFQGARDELARRRAER